MIETGVSTTKIERASWQKNAYRIQLVSGIVTQRPNVLLAWVTKIVC